MYSISLVDRTNLGLALVAGMAEDLELTVGNRYTILVMIFFVAYILFEIPSVSGRALHPPGFLWTDRLTMHRDTTELDLASGWSCQLASFPGYLVWIDPDRYGIHKVLGYNGPLQSVARCD